MIVPALWLLLQGGAPTVGDTLWLSRTVAVPPGRTLRAADWQPADPLELLGPPRITTRGDSADIVYPAVVWRAGRLSVEMPGPLLLGAAGGVDSLPPLRLDLRIASVLPAVSPDSALAPQPRAGFIARGSRTIVPLLVALALTALLLAPLHWWWRRRGPRAGPRAPAGRSADSPIERWADAGEARAVAATVTARLRALIESHAPTAHRALDTEALLAQLAADRPGWPLHEVSTVLRSLDEARFGEQTAIDVLDLARDASALESRLAGPGA